MRPKLILFLLATVAAPAVAQTNAPVTARVDRLEKEMRAVQRKVFPGGAGGQPGYFEPEITGPVAQAQPGNASAPITDLTARVASLEQELARMTGQVEQNGFRLKQVEDQLARLKTDTGTRLETLERGVPAATEAPSRAIRPATTNAVEADAPDASPPRPEPRPASAAAGTAADEEAYLAGYRLWEQKDYAAAEPVLKAYVAKYPQSRRASYAQNLLGRTYLDNGKPAAAAVAFHANYTKNPRGERAPDSLYFLGQALTKLDKPNLPKACEAYDALTREYGDTINQALKDRVAKARTDAKCKASAN
ncbi:tetratricopeptide repeat protein [Sphingomonas montana]|uniref:tetratricopeptide repeat protein n=1 Tax=Sphingomonas montana TaxID=1843236 RepID=UPI00096F89BC|nr:tetratricopeptide repeat protein [Sphingomonas montana]